MAHAVRVPNYNYVDYTATTLAASDVRPKEDAMSIDVTRHVSDRLHPMVSIAIVGLALWLILSVWEFARDGHTDFLLVVVSGFFVMVLALAYALWRTSQNQQAPDTSQNAEDSFGRWAAGEFDIWQGRVKGINAAVEILLPIAAVAFGMTAFGLVLYFTAH